MQRETRIEIFTSFPAGRRDGSLLSGLSVAFEGSRGSALLRKLVIDISVKKHFHVDIPSDEVMRGVKKRFFTSRCAYITFFEILETETP